MIDNIQFANEQAFIQANDMISMRLEKVTSTTSTVLSKTFLYEKLSKDYKNISPSDIMKDATDINREISLLKNNKDIIDVILYISETNPISEYSYRYRIIENISNSELFKYYNDKSSDSQWILWKDKSNNIVVSMLYNIYNEKDYSKKVGILRVDMDSKVIMDILNNSVNTHESTIYMFNNEHNILLSTGKTALNLDSKLNSLFDETYSHTISTKIKMNGEWYFISWLRSIKPTWYRPDWILLSVTPLKSIQNQINRIMFGVLLVEVISTITFFCFACLFSLSLIGRINLLIKNVRKVQKGNFNINIPSEGTDEISELIQNFNFMAKRINVLLDEQADYINQKRKSELTALQAQINPHFLYNTLDMINWSAVVSKAPDISETVQSLSKFYKLSLNNGKTVVPLKDEIQHVKAYMDIQMRRFDYAFEFVVNVEESLLEYSVLKMALQPLAENAIQHGIMKKDKRHGTISVDAWRENNRLKIAVLDDGVGIEPEKLELLLKDGFSSKNSYGLSNVNKRIQLYFGLEFGLSIESNINKYTKITITLPVNQDSETD